MEVPNCWIMFKIRDNKKSRSKLIIIIRINNQIKIQIKNIEIRVHKCRHHCSNLGRAKTAQPNALLLKKELTRRTYSKKQEFQTSHLTTTVPSILKVRIQLYARHNSVSNERTPVTLIKKEWESILCPSLKVRNKHFQILAKVTPRKFRATRWVIG